MQPIRANSPCVGNTVVIYGATILGLACHQELGCRFLNVLQACLFTSSTPVT